MKKVRREIPDHTNKIENSKTVICILKCTKILLYNLASLCEQKRLKGSVVVYQGGSFFDYFFNTHTIKFDFRNVYISAVNRHTQIKRQSAQSPAPFLYIASVLAPYLFSVLLRPWGPSVKAIHLSVSILTYHSARYPSAPSSPFL